MKKQIFILCLFHFSFFTCHFSFSQTWQYYDSLRTVYQEKQSLDTAYFYAEKALLSVKELRGDNDTLYADMLSAIARISYDLGKYAKSIEYCEKENKIRKNLQGNKNALYTASLNNLGILYSKVGNYQKSEERKNQSQD